MNFTSIRIITGDIRRLVGFYENVLGFKPTWFTEEFAELPTPGGTIAIGSENTMVLFGKGAARSGDNHSVIIEFLVQDVDGDYERMNPFLPEIIQEPTTMPWGNRSLLLRDPDGNLVNLFTPVSDQATSKYAGRR